MNEIVRLQALSGYHLMDTSPEDGYVEIAQWAAELAGTQVACIGLVDEKREWFLARYRFEDSEFPREYAFGTHAILKPQEVLIVSDARYDERFHNNPLTIGKPNIVFYAGVPLINAQGYALGVLAVMDSRPRELSGQKIQALQVLAKLVETEFELRKTKMQLERCQNS
jgi:GAF domain-containing protein